MKTVLAIILAMSASAAWADEKAPDAVAAAPIEVLIPSAKADVIEIPAAAPSNFCGQSQMLDWFLNSTEVGRQLRLDQAKAREQALSSYQAQPEPQMLPDAGAKPEAVVAATPKTAVPEQK